jgi:hypothetical protein
MLTDRILHMSSYPLLQPVPASELLLTPGSYTTALQTNPTRTLIPFLSHFHTTQAPMTGWFHLLPTSPLAVLDHTSSFLPQVASTISTWSFCRQVSFSPTCHPDCDQSWNFATWNVPLSATTTKKLSYLVLDHFFSPVTCCTPVHTATPSYLRPPTSWPLHVLLLSSRTCFSPL